MGRFCYWGLKFHQKLALPTVCDNFGKTFSDPILYLLSVHEVKSAQKVSLLMKLYEDLERMKLNR